MKLALKIKNLPHPRGYATLYRVYPPMQGDSGDLHDFVVAVAIYAPHPLTQIIGVRGPDVTDPLGEPLFLSRSHTDHDLLFDVAGYAVR